MKSNRSFLAYIDDIDTITIENDCDCSVFYLNDIKMHATLIRKENERYFFELKAALDYQTEYILKDETGKETFVFIRYVTKKDAFDQKFHYDGNDLGPTYQKTHTTFKIWTPIATRVSLCYVMNGETSYQLMEKKAGGIFETTVFADLSEALYCYYVYYNNEEHRVTDLYSYSCNANGKMSAVIDLNRLSCHDEIDLPEIRQLNQAIIYEVSVRDFSADGSLGKENRHCYDAFSLENQKTKKGNPIGIDYLASLGITHVQLMPVLDFVTIDEKNPDASYNWGYDPCCFNHLEGSYSKDPDDPYRRMNEFRNVVHAFHKRKIRVVLDVVFNHTYYGKQSVLNETIINYHYLMDASGNWSNGSFCGNDLDTTRLMTKKYIVDMCIRLVRLYHIDGLRLDLMGILTIDLVNEIASRCKAINPSFIVYGEGWNMPSMLPEPLRANIYNHAALPHVGFFNDSFRDTMRGKSYSSDMKEQGYLCGNSYKAYHAIRAMRGCVERNCYFSEAEQSINYVECHDNATLYDKLIVCNEKNTDSERNKIQLCMLAATIFAQGVPFLHMGVEFARSKKGFENSYNLGDEINAIHWEAIDRYEKNIQALKDFIAIRKAMPYFYLNDKKTIVNSIDGEIIDNCYIKLTYAYDGKVAVLLFNPTRKKVRIDLKGEYLLYCNLYGKVHDDLTYEVAELESYSFAMYIK